MPYLDGIPYYVYKIELTSTGQYYYGSRYNHVKRNRLPDQDIWIEYFTSSKLVKSLIKVHGKESFKAHVIYTSQNMDDVYWTEQDLIKDNIHDVRCLNQSYVNKKDRDKVLLTVGMSWWRCGEEMIYSKLCPGDGWIKEGRPHDEEAKKLISVGLKGKPKSVEHRRKLSATNTGRKTKPCADSTKALIKEKNTGLQWWNDGHKHVFVHNCPGEGWVRGALPNFTEEGMAKHKANRADRIYWHNGVEQRMERECPGPGWVRGRLYYRGKRVEKAPTPEQIANMLLSSLQ